MRLGAGASGSRARGGASDALRPSAVGSAGAASSGGAAGSGVGDGAGSGSGSGAGVGAASARPCPPRMGE
ncbi:hypothetical protein DW219_06985 [Desulfovibrio sp. AM18-2]|nr:hypothetical protein DW219_06985 [Desulfovibrio sp. AM18-2]